MPLETDAVELLKLEVIPNIFRDAALFGLEAATPSNLNGKTALWIPRAVSKAPGGRESIYDLAENDETLLGIYVVNTVIVKKLVTRSGPKRYRLSLQTATGEELFSGEGDLEVRDSQVGYGSIMFKGAWTENARTLDIEPVEAVVGHVWVLWSCIQV